MAGKQPGFWDIEHRLRELSEHGDPLEKLATTVDFEIFRAELVTARGARDPAKGGRPGFDAVLKVPDASAAGDAWPVAAAYLVGDPLSWMRFCGPGPGEAAPETATLKILAPQDADL